MARLLNDGLIMTHPLVIGEISLGHLQNRKRILDTMKDLPLASSASHEEVLHFIETHSLFGKGIGFIDAHLLAAAKLTPGLSIWTRDKRLLAESVRLGLAGNLPH